MYSKSFELLFKLWSFVGLAVVGELATELVEEITSRRFAMAIISFLIWANLALAAHEALLLRAERDKSKDLNRTFGFALRTFGLGVLIVISVLFTVFGIVPVLASQGSGGSERLMILGLGISGAVSFILVIGLIGTVLPAFVTGKGQGLGAAFSRGVSQFGWTAAHLIIGPLFMFVASAVAVMVGLSFLEPKTNILNSGSLPNIPVIAVLAVAYVVQALATVMTTWVVSTAYKRAEGIESIDTSVF